MATNKLYFCDTGQNTPGIINELDGGTVTTRYQRTDGPFLSVATSDAGGIYFTTSGDSNIYGLNGNTDSVVYTHREPVDYVRVGPSGALFFSVASGAGADGTIYQLNGSVATPFYTVILKSVGGFWLGSFDFGPEGDLWLSHGNFSPASLFQVVQGKPIAVHQSTEGIAGFFFDDPKSVTFAAVDRGIRRVTGLGGQPKETTVFLPQWRMPAVFDVQPVRGR